MNLKLITTHKDYLLFVDVSDNQKFRGGELLRHDEQEVHLCTYPHRCEGSECNLIIAHLPINNAPVLEGVPLLEDYINNLVNERR